MSTTNNAAAAATPQSLKHTNAHDANGDEEEEEGEEEEEMEPVKRTWGDRLKGLRHFFYNPHTGEVVGRTPKSWGQICLFYFVYFSFLGALFAFTMWALVMTLSYELPKYQDRVASPGLMIRPRAPLFEINFMSNSLESYEPYVNSINDLLSSYPNTSENFCDAGLYRDEQAGAGQPGRVPLMCPFSRKDLGLCSGLEDPMYGFTSGTPCVLLKMNRIIGFKPGNHTNPVKVTCDGKKEEQQHLLGDIEFFPNDIFDPMYFPYYGKVLDGTYTQPLVAARFLNLTHDTPVSIECRLEGNGIVNKHERDRFLGRIAFTFTVSS
ncbi:sodium/potassium-transporting ATPase subunit beta-3-like [Lethenteron reissneri]|uniref:sodium/potassium-transporting ATPase subunit beta-3-like n=1 Tax=Lethenteron reissneri TaxID=7753 RepID=UPI002AB61889|nr:sodium/potassium-transporting ATPase subunit beta-3-like [Lethenteron reissneri]